MHLVRVALDVPLPTLFDYRLEHTRRELVGARVLVPFGRGQRAGIILEVGGEPEVPPERIKRVAHVFADEAPLAPDVLQLMRFSSRYYHHPIGQVVMGALPQALRRAHASRDASARVLLTAAALAADWSTLPARALARRRVLEHLRAHGPCTPALVRSLASTAPRALRDLMADGWVAFEEAVPPGLEERVAHAATPGPALTAEQAEALEAIGGTLGRFTAWLLLGVTGSGKTEVYLRLIERVLARGGQVLVLVPEINLTPQLEARLAARFPGASLAGLHSGVPEAERLRRWRAAESDGRVS